MRSLATIKTFEEMTLDEIEALGDSSLIEKYNRELSELEANKLSKEIVEVNYGDSIANIFMAIEEEELHIKSEYLFPGQKIVVYPGIRETHASKEFTCDFSGARISKGSLYVSYRPMLKNIENGATYVLNRTIRVETGYEGDLPTDIVGIEDLNDKILNYSVQDDSDIDYDHLFWQVGGELSFKKLNRRKKYEIRYSKRPQGI